MKKLACCFAVLGFSVFSVGAETIEYETAPAVVVDYSARSVKYADASVSFDCANGQASILDTAVPYFECELNNKWFYAATPDFRFAYNTEWLELPARWNHGSDSYNLVGTKKSKKYGLYYRVVSYEADKPGDFFVTDFSFKYGVVAFYHFNEDSGASDWFLLSSKYGLGRP